MDPARKRVETAERNRQEKVDPLKRDAVVTQTMKKPGKTQISEEDWSAYVDAIRREGSRGNNEKQVKPRKEIENDKN